MGSVHGACVEVCCSDRILKALIAQTAGAAVHSTVLTRDVRYLLDKYKPSRMKSRRAAAVFVLAIIACSALLAAGAPADSKDAKPKRKNLPT